MASLPTFDVRWRQLPNGHWLVMLWSGDRLVWADTTPWIAQLHDDEPWLRATGDAT